MAIGDMGWLRGIWDGYRGYAVAVGDTGRPSAIGWQWGIWDGYRGYGMAIGHEVAVGDMGWP